MPGRRRTTKAPAPSAKLKSAHKKLRAAQHEFLLAAGWQNVNKEMGLWLPPDARIGQQIVSQGDAVCQAVDSLPNEAVDE